MYTIGLEHLFKFGNNLYAIKYFLKFQKNYDWHYTYRECKLFTACKIEFAVCITFQQLKVEALPSASSKDWVV